jgi:hypothetical protein
MSRKVLLGRFIQINIRILCNHIYEGSEMLIQKVLVHSYSRRKTMIKTAKMVRKLTGFRGHAALYELSHAIATESNSLTTYVVVSAVNAPFSGPETYIFESTPEGEVVSFTELEGSVRGTMSHSEALSEAGYAIEE